jgi:hypothetical protein
MAVRFRRIGAFQVLKTDGSAHNADRTIALTSDMTAAFNLQNDPTSDLSRSRHATAFLRIEEARQEFNTRYGRTRSYFDVYAEKFLSSSCTGYDENNCVAGMATSGGGPINTKIELTKAACLYGGVAYHEYTHTMIYDIYATLTIESDIGKEGEADAMDEGFAFYFSSVFRNDPKDQGTGWDLSIGRKAPLTSSQDSHWNGMIIGGAAWDLGRQTGFSNTTASELIFNAIVAMRDKSTPHSWEQYLRTVYEEDDNDGDLTNGTPNYKSIYAAFTSMHNINSPSEIESFMATYIRPQIGVINPLYIKR